MADFTIIILCGGAGRRMMGKDKPLMELAGKPIVSRIIDNLSACDAPVLISANRNRNRYAAYAAVVADELSDYQGPLAGIHACLARITTPYAFVCPGDSPWITPRLVERLGAARNEADAEAACAHDGKRRQCLHLMLDARVVNTLGAYLDNGGRSARGWLDLLDTVDVDCADLRTELRDIDTPDALSEGRVIP